jgi:hypothetical protein
MGRRATDVEETLAFRRIPTDLSRRYLFKASIVEAQDAGVADSA